jgi:mRNA interferase YafQ
VLAALLTDAPLPPANRDHALTGEWADARECHVRPDLLLVYRKPDADSLYLLRLGSHALLFGR